MERELKNTLLTVIFILSFALVSGVSASVVGIASLLLFFLVPMYSNPFYWGWKAVTSGVVGSVVGWILTMRMVSGFSFNELIFMALVAVFFFFITSFAQWSILKKFP